MNVDVRFERIPSGAHGRLGASPRGDRPEWERGGERVEGGGSGDGGGGSGGGGGFSGGHDFAAQDSILTRPFA